MVENVECFVGLSSNYVGNNPRNDSDCSRALGLSFITTFARPHQCNAHQHSGPGDRLAIVHAYPNHGYVVPSPMVRCTRVDYLLLRLDQGYQTGWVDLFFMIC